MIVPTPSVAITELTLSLVTMRPLTSPISAPSAEHDEDRDRDRQLVMDDEAGDQHAVQAGGKADRQVELADDDRQVSPPAMIIASDAWLRTLVKLPSVGKARGDRSEKTRIITTRPKMVP